VHPLWGGAWKKPGWFARFGDAPEGVIARYFPICGTSFFHLQLRNAGLAVLAGTLDPIDAAIVSTRGLQRFITPRGETPRPADLVSNGVLVG